MLVSGHCIAYISIAMRFPHTTEYNMLGIHEICVLRCIVANHVIYHKIFLNMGFYFLVCANGMSYTSGFGGIKFQHVFIILKCRNHTIELRFI